MSDDIPHHSDIVIVGGGPAGLMAATYAARARRSVVVLTGSMTSSQLSSSPGVENFPGVPEPTPGFELIERMAEQAERAGARLLHEDATSLDLETRPFQVNYGSTPETSRSLQCDALVLCMGARARTLDVPGAKEAWGISISSCAVCDAHIVEHQPTLVIGGGDSAAEEALYLRRYSDVVYLVHRRDTLRASPVLQERLREAGVRLLLESTVEEFEGGAHITSAVVTNVVTGSRQILNIHSAFYGIGHIPETDMVKDVLETHHGGFLVLQPGSQMTSIPGVFAAGDVADYVSRQAVCAAGQGAAAAIEACRWLETREE